MHAVEWFLFALNAALVAMFWGFAVQALARGDSLPGLTLLGLAIIMSMLLDLP